MRGFHIFEEWSDEACGASRLVAELVEGEQWAWVHHRIEQTDDHSNDTEAWRRSEDVQAWIDEFAASVERPAEIDVEWIEAPTDKAPGPADDATPLVVDHKFHRTGCSGDCGPLQLVQVAYGSANPHHAVGRPLKNWWVAVDAGPYSPWHLWEARPVGHPTRPYFYGPRRFRTESTGEHLILYDRPGAAGAQSQLYFEAVLICIKHRGGNGDTAISSLRYGWRGNGTIRCAGPELEEAEPIEAAAPSPWFGEIVAYDFPNYKYS